MEGNVTGLNWEGYTNVAWGSHLYYTTVATYDKEKRPGGDRPIILNKYATGTRGKRLRPTAL